MDQLTALIHYAALDQGRRLAYLDSPPRRQGRALMRRTIEGNSSNRGGAGSRFQALSCDNWILQTVVLKLDLAGRAMVLTAGPSGTPNRGYAGSPLGIDKNCND